MSRRRSTANVRRSLISCIAFIAVTAQCLHARAQQPQWPCVFDRPSVNPMIPNDVQFSDQPTFNCFAWQEFIGLNWRAAAGQRGVPDPQVSAAEFGAPGATSPTVWETYKDRDEVFLTGGAKPKPWGDPPPEPHCATAAAGVRELLEKPEARVLYALSPFGDFVLDDSRQASGQWLADQANNLIYYEIKVNKDEFESIVANGFYDGDVQKQTASTGVNPTPGGLYQVKLPAGCNSGSCPNGGAQQTGAIELKSAWRILTDSTQFGRYLTTRAVLIDKTGACSQAMMGLVGLHIIHKTVSQPQFIWATFEHVDNVPPASSATFNNPGCKCQTVVPQSCGGSPTTYQNCGSGQAQGQACGTNIPPSNYPPTVTCPAYSVQVTRSHPISNDLSDPVTATNAAARAMLIAANPRTVFQYYELIDVLWSTSSQDNYKNQPAQPGPLVPLSMSGATPDASALPVANTTMETYVQNLTCLACHVNATVPGANYASDFSFILGDAKSATAMATAAVAHRRHLPAGLVRFRQ